MLQNFQGTEPNATFKFKCERYVDGLKPKKCFIISVYVCVCVFVCVRACEHKWN